MPSSRTTKTYWPLVVIFAFILGSISQIVNIPQPPIYGQDDQILLGFAKGYNFFDFYRFFDPTWGWHFRPTLLFWLVGGDRLAGGNPIPLFWGGVLLHGLTAAGVAFLSSRMTNRPLAGTIAAALFIWMNQDSQTPRWIAAANIMFVAIAFCTAIYTWKMAHETGKPLWRIGTVASVIFALLSKEEALALLPLLVYYDLELAPSDTLGSRVQRLTPIFISTAIYLPLTLISHPYSQAFYTARAGFAGGIGWRPPREFNLWLTPKFILDALPQVLGKWSPLAMWACFVLLSCRACRYSAGRVFLVAFLLSSILILAMIGTYADQNRFKYIPSTMLCVVLGIGFVAGESRITGHLAIIIAVLISLISPELDSIVGVTESPLPHDLALGLACIAAAVMSYFKWVDKTTVLVVTLCAVGGHLDGIATLANPDNPHIWALVTLVCAPLVASRSKQWEWWQSTVFAAIVLADTESILPLTVLTWTAVFSVLKYCARRSQEQAPITAAPQQA